MAAYNSMYQTLRQTQIVSKLLHPLSKVRDCDITTLKNHSRMTSALVRSYDLRFTALPLPAVLTELLAAIDARV
jgi:hypothetical protein